VTFGCELACDCIGGADNCLRGHQAIAKTLLCRPVRQLAKTIMTLLAIRQAAGALDVENVVAAAE